MRIGGAVGAVVLDAHIIAVCTLRSHFLHNAIAGGIDGRARGRREIDALVKLREAEDRMLAHAET
jgi:hypothetical protein